MTPELQATLDAALATLYADIDAAQTAYHDTLLDAPALDGETTQAARGHYAQVVPAGDWGVLGMATPVIDGCTVWVDDYVSGDGSGWVLNAEAVEAGTTYRKTMQSGNESWRERGWVAVAT